MNFSERAGYKVAKSNPLEHMEPGLKNEIWTTLYSHMQERYISWGYTGYGDSRYRDNNAITLWTNVFGQKISALPYAGDYLEKVEVLYDQLSWHEVYDLIEFFLERNSLDGKIFNEILAKNNSAYRVIDSVIQPILDTATIKAIESAHKIAPTEEIRNHLKKAESLYSDRKSPHFDNACLESIKAVENTCRLLLHNNDTLSENIKKLKKNHNQHIISILDKINTFRGDTLSHGKKINGHSATREDAILLHTLCAGFVNYFISKRTEKNE